MPHKYRSQSSRKENDIAHQITTKCHSRVCNKLMEHIISKHLLNHLEANNILFDKQHGCRKKAINQYTIASLHTRYLANLSSGRQTDVIIMDFAKAFDKLPHHRLITNNQISLLKIRQCLIYERDIEF